MPMATPRSKRTIQPRLPLPPAAVRGLHDTQLGLLISRIERFIAIQKLLLEQFTILDVWRPMPLRLSACPVRIDFAH